MKIKHIILNIVMFLILLSMFAVQHELVHKAIFTAWGCDSEFGIDWKGPFTRAVGDCEPNDSMLLAHSINEVVGYTVSPFLIFILYYVWLLGGKK